jgi:hypothetical protein
LIYKIITTDKRTGMLFQEFCCENWSSGDQEVFMGETIVFANVGESYRIEGYLYIEYIIGQKSLEKPVLICTVE